jgi:cytochrome c
VVDRAKGAADGYSYSAALMESGGAWSYLSLNAFLAKPKAYIEGTKMNFAGFDKAGLQKEPACGSDAWMSCA